MSAQRMEASFRDPAGFVFRREGVVHRQVNRSYQQEFDLLHRSGLYDDLTADGLLVPHEEVDVRLAMSEGAYRVIRPAQLPFVSYPYEWCFGQLKHAALATLQVLRKALAYGMTLKDASAYNVQWLGGRPVFIDTLSFERYREGEPWRAYRQFCGHFLAPLALMVLRDPRLGKLLRVHLDGVPLDLACRLLPWHAMLKPSLLLHLFLHARSQQQYETTCRRQDHGNPVEPEADLPSTKSTSSKDGQRGRFSRLAFEGLIGSLERAIYGLRLRSAQTAWSDYYTATHNYGAEGLAQKTHAVRQLLEQIRPEAVWDLGANSGAFSRLAAECGAKMVVAWDADHACVEANYRQAQEQRESAILPLLLDLTNPSPGLGWAGSERQSMTERGPADAVLALGLVHHMAIANNVPLGEVAGYIKRLGRWLIIEWVPKTDSQVRRLLASRDDIFPQYERAAFEREFEARYAIERCLAIEGTQRSVYLMKAR